MKTIKRYMLIAFSALTLPACTLLDTEPQDFITPDKFYNTQEELEAALRGVYMTLADNGLYGMNIPARLGLSADIGYETYDYDSSSVGFYDVSTNDAMVLTYWRLCYAGINRANKLLESIDRPAIDETDRPGSSPKHVSCALISTLCWSTASRTFPLCSNLRKMGTKRACRSPKAPRATRIG